MAVHQLSLHVQLPVTASNTIWYTLGYIKNLHEIFVKNFRPNACYRKPFRMVVRAVVQLHFLLL